MTNIIEGMLRTHFSMDDDQIEKLRPLYRVEIGEDELKQKIQVIHTVVHSGGISPENISKFAFQSMEHYLSTPDL